MKSFIILFVSLLLFSSCNYKKTHNTPSVSYTVDLANADQNIFNIHMDINGMDNDTIHLKLPQWMPGYYQIMEYCKNMTNIKASDILGNDLQVQKLNNNSWQVVNPTKGPLYLTYNITATKQFVANSFIDSTHAYIIPENNFLYIPDHLDIPVEVNILPDSVHHWNNIATGLTKQNDATFTATDFDMLYDCPILIGRMDTLPSFYIQGIKHQFTSYNGGSFNKKEFNANLKKVVAAASSFFDEIPYNQYTFIGIGPGHGGIEHLNNTTISFDGNQLNTDESIKHMMSFIAHEYFHHYNVKRIRPVELGPFDYENGSRTTQLWISEGLTVYYEYMTTKKAGITSTDDLIASFEEHINTVENNPGRLKQSLVQSSYNTWEDGPFGVPGQTISYYEKGPLVGLLLDLSIRNATHNQKSLDDVMMYMYSHYYKKLNRGFTDAEFQQVCEITAGTLLTDVFDYVHTTKELDYNKYLLFAGLKVEKNKVNGKNRYKIIQIDTPTPLQQNIFKSWAKEPKDHREENLDTDILVN